MQKFLAELIQRLSSRKFLITLFGLVAVTAYPEQANQIVALIGTFVAAEGIGDAAQRYSDPKQAAAKTEFETAKLEILGANALPDTGVDKTTFVPGNMSGQ